MSRIMVALLIFVISSPALAADRVRYDVEVFDAASRKLIFASGEADEGLTAPLSVSQADRSALPVMMTVRPFYRDDQLVTLFGFNLPDMAGTISYRGLLNASCGQTVRFQVGEIGSINRYTVVLTPTKM